MEAIRKEIADLICIEINAAQSHVSYTVQFLFALDERLSFACASLSSGLSRLRIKEDMMKKRIETERLLLRPLTEEDAEAVFEWVSDPEVNRYMPYPRYTELDAVKKWIASIKPEQNEFAFVLKRTGKVIGSGSVRYDADLGGFTFGYNVNRRYWGNGYATEAAKAMISWARKELGVTVFIAVYADDNVASGNVIRKCGLTFSRHTSYSKFDGSATFQASVYVGHFEKL